MMNVRLTGHLFFLDKKGDGAHTKSKVEFKIIVRRRKQCGLKSRV
ncbi:hypothetical protein JOD02_000176 [Caldicoprobacter guelmensis]|nr:hypothetical protein [Caldicoprobacter guelmensis]